MVKKKKYYFFYKKKSKEFITDLCKIIKDMDTVILWIKKEMFMMDLG